MMFWLRRCRNGLRATHLPFLLSSRPMSSTSCPLSGVICGPPVKPIFNSSQVVVDDHDRSVTYDKSWTSAGINYEWESTTSWAGAGGSGIFRFSGMPHLVVHSTIHAHCCSPGRDIYVNVRDCLQQQCHAGIWLLQCLVRNGLCRGVNSPYTNEQSE
jgi:hypothetical protein